MLGRDIVVVHPLGLIVGGLQRVGDAAREIGLRRAVDLGHGVDQCLGLGDQLPRVVSHLGEYLGHDALFLPQQGQQQVGHLDLAGVGAAGQVLGGGEGLLGLLGIAIEIY